LLSRELALLHRSAERFFTEPEDRALAEVSDLQRAGGSQGHAKAVQRGNKHNGEQQIGSVKSG
jgi:hypothetical protein